jgi:proteasome lid subunit RPN8/RPN11
VSVVLPITNIASDNKAFLAEPFEQFCALRKLQTENLQLLAIYHSHPGGGVAPSQDDLAYAQQWPCAHLVVAFGAASDAEAKMRAFRFDSRGCTEEVEIQLP